MGCNWELYPYLQGKINLKERGFEMTYIAFHVEKWLYGTTRMEMEMDEIACFTYILARAAVTGADPPGLIYYFSEEHLASQLQLPLELLQRTLEKCKKFKKIKIKTLIRENKYVLSVVNWEKYQHVYMHQKAYRARQKAEKEAQKKLISEGTKKHNQNITLRKIGEDRRGNEKILEDIKGEDIEADNPENPNTPNSDNLETPSPLPSNSNSFKGGGITIKEQFLSMLKGCNGYPFDELQDSLLFDITFEDCPGINIIEQTEKKIDWWKERPGALNANPREKLKKWFKKEYEFQKRGGPQKIGEIMQGVEDPDKRKWLEKFTK